MLKLFPQAKAIMEVTHGKNHFYLTELDKLMKEIWRCKKQNKNVDRPMSRSQRRVLHFTTHKLFLRVTFKNKSLHLCTTVLKKIRLYCIISKYDSFIHVRGEKTNKVDTLKTHIQNICTHSGRYLGVLSNKTKGRKLNINKEWNATEGKILSQKKRTEVQKEIT